MCLLLEILFLHSHRSDSIDLAQLREKQPLNRIIILPLVFKVDEVEDLVNVIEALVQPNTRLLEITDILLNFFTIVRFELNNVVNL